MVRDGTAWSIAGKTIELEAKVRREEISLATVFLVEVQHFCPTFARLTKDIIA